MAALTDQRTRPDARANFAGNWLAGSAKSRSLRRRLMAVLRNAHRVLGMGRGRLGLGALGIGGNGVRAAAIVGLGIAAATLSTGVASAYEAGDGASADQNEDVAVGDDANADGVGGGPYSVAIGFSTDAAGNGTYNLQRTDGLGFSDATPAYGGTAVGDSAVASNSGSAFGSDSAASGLLAVAVGANTTASGVSSAAFGNAAFATEIHSLAVGFQNVAAGVRSTAIGPVATAEGEASTAIGLSASASGEHALAFGSSPSDDITQDTATNTRASGDDSMAFGTSAVATGDASIAQGLDAVANEDNAMAIGTSAEALGDAGVALGDGASSGATGFNVAIGSGGTSANAADAAEGAVAIGRNQEADGDGAVAIGVNNTATAQGAVAIGRASTADTTGALAFGDSVNATANRAVAIGATSQATFNSAVAIGNNAQAHTGLGAIAIGRLAEAAGGGAISLGNSAQAGAQGALAFGDGAVANLANDIAMGTDAQATGNASGSALSIGAGNEATGAGAVALGDPSTATGDGAIAQGLDSTATGDGTVALGNTAQAGGGNQDVGVAGDPAQGAVSIGYETEATGQGSVALGNTSTATGAGSLAFGDAADASVAGGVALGSDSVANTGPGVAGYVPSGANSGAINATQGTLGAVSVGDAANDEYRQITGVAAGTEDSDAVNVSQLQGVEELATTGFDLSADGANQTNVGPGDAVDLSNTDGNIEVDKTAADNDVTFDLADDITADSLTAGDSVLDSGGLTVDDGTDVTTVGPDGLAVAGGPSVTASGIDAGGDTITNVAPGTAGTDAVNVDQLEDLGDTPITFAGNTGGDVDRELGETLDITGGNATAGTYSGDNISTVANGADGIEIQMAESPNFGGVVINEGGSGRIAGLSDGVDPDDAVNLSQLEAVEGTANAGFDLSADGANQTNVGPGDAVDLGNTDGNIEVDKTAADNDVTFDLADDITADSLTAGDSVLDSGGLTVDDGTDVTTVGPDGLAVAGGPSVTASGIDAGGDTITNVADGTNPSDAVNVSQLDAVETTANAGWDLQANGGGTANVAPGDTVEFLDGQNIEITRAGTDITIATAADLTADSLTLNSGQTFDAGGLDMDGTTIANLAPGAAGTDAVNLDQLEDAQTRYYSVNDGGTAGGNFNNNGATGINALAAGVDAAAAGDSGVAVGEASQADIEGSVALGSGSISDRAIAPAAGTLPAGSATIEYNTADHTLLGAVSLGDDTSGGVTYRQITNVADGTDAQDAVTIRQLQGAMQSFSVTGINYFHANSTAGDSVAAGQESVAIGPTTVVNGDNGIGMGNGATVDSTAPGGTAIGQDSYVQSADGIAMGTESRAGGEQSVALGAGAQSDHAGSVALGSNSVTDDAVGTDSTTINGTTYDFAGDTPVGTVSVGDTDAERTITNVAAGRISADSTDAINGSQLFATNTAVEDLSDDIGDVGDVAQNSVQYDTDSSGSKTNSVTLQGGDPNAPVVIHNVGEGVADNDAVNVAQLDQGVEESRTYTDDRVDYAIDTSNDYTDTVADQTLNDANSYTDQKFDQLNRNVGEIRSEARQAAAIGLAAASLRYDDRPGKLSVSMGGGYWQSESALAFGAGYTSENGRVRGNLTGTTAGGDWGVGAGVSFTLN